MKKKSNKKKSNILIVTSAILGAIILILVTFLLSKDKEYTITFDSDGGSIIEDQIIKKGELVSKPEDPEKEDYLFLHWNYNDLEYDFSSEVTTDMTLKAVWQEIVKYQVTLTVDGITKTFNVSDLLDIDLDSIFEPKDGYELVWYLNDTEYDITKELTEDVNLVGKYIKIKTEEDNKNNNSTNDNSNKSSTQKDIYYTVKFNSNGGSSVSSVKVKKGDKVSKPTSKRNGYTLIGWYLNNNLYDFNKSVTSNITLKAKWQINEGVKSYEVKFDSNGGSSVETQKVVANDKVLKPNNPTKSGYVFLEWQLNGKTYDFNSKVTKNITLVAKWRELYKYTVTFDSNGGSSVNGQVVTEGNTASKPSNPTRSEYAFVEWQLNGSKYDFNSKVTKNITLVAKWRNLEKYTVTFDSNGGSSVEDKIVWEGSKVTKPNNPSKGGYRFISWQLNGSNYDFNKPVTSNITLNAKWQEIKYKITIRQLEGDAFTPVGYAVVKDDIGNIVSYKSIMYSDKIGTLCVQGETVNIPDFNNDGFTSYIVKLSNGTEVKATK